jgi:hypothetical protein
VRKQHPVKRSSHARVTVFAAIAAAVVALAFGAGQFLSGEQPGTGSARLCPKLEVDGSSGEVRSKGMVPCDNAGADNRRLDLIRDSFKKH